MERVSDTHLVRYNLYFAVRMYLGIYTSARGCQVWFTYQAVIVLVLLLTVEGLLMHRREFPSTTFCPKATHPQSLVYALFLRNRLILVILIMFVAGQITSMWVSAHISFPSNKHTVTCLMVSNNPGNAYFR